MRSSPSFVEYYRARYYQPGIGRFGSEDPIGLNGGPSLYTYVGSRPVADTDPLGLIVHRSAITAPGPYHRCPGNDRMTFWDEPPNGTRWNSIALNDFEAEFRAHCEARAEALDRYWAKHPWAKPPGTGPVARTYALGPFMLGIQGGGFTPGSVPGITFRAFWTAVGLYRTDGEVVWLRQ